jgi:DNA polymerase-1
LILTPILIEKFKSMANRPKFFILDSFSLIYQVYHAIPAMTGPAGQPTHAVFGIMRDLMNLIKTHNPDFLAAAWDGPGPVFRESILPSYKAQREEMPTDLRLQLPVIKEAFQAFEVPVVEALGSEADDVIATLARMGVEHGLDVTICTSDKDARQLIGPHVRLFNIRKQEAMDEPALLADWGIRPDQIVDLLSLTGDTADNIPGVPGIGVKTAAQLLQQFDSLDNLLANLDKVKGDKKRESLKAHTETALTARTLVKLQTDLELGTDWSTLKLTPPNIPNAVKLCQQCGFHKFQKDLTDAYGSATPAVEWRTDYRTVDTPEALDKFVEELAAQPKFCLDTETTDTNPCRARLVGLSFAWKPELAYYIPVRGPMFDQKLDEQLVLEKLRPILEDPSRTIVGQNIKYDWIVLAQAGVTLAGRMVDSMILSYLLESGERNHSLDEISQRLLDHKMIPISDLIGKGKNQKKMDEVEVALVAEYAAEDADATWRITEKLEPIVRDQDLWTLYDNVERPLVEVLARMEKAGVVVDVPRLKQLSDEFAKRLAEIEREIYLQAGGEFNIASAQQLREILYDRLKLPILGKTPGGEPSTAAEILEELAPMHPLPRMLMEHRQLSKLKNTYLDALPTVIGSDSRVHASFNQTVTATGRLSSSEPNLQNIPVRSEQGRQIRQAFIAPGPDWVLLTADYSQIELRMLAHFCQDENLLEAFRTGRDIHNVVAGQIFGVDESAVTDEQRRQAKTVNFGVIYGLSAYGLASRLSISQSEAAIFIEAYFAKYPGIDTWMTTVLEEAKSTGRVKTILGRRRPIQGIKSTTGRQRNLAERTAINTVIQGSAADLIKMAMIRIDQELRALKLQSRLILQIHDELVFEVPKSELAQVRELVRRLMNSALDLNVPIEVDVAAGPNWLDVD